jgi:zinc protease
MDLPFTRHALANGLTVLIHEDHRCPIAGVNLWYHVGSKDESPGRTGFAHLFEHLMFEGSEHHDRDYFYPLQQAGASLNGSTNADRTNYWEVVPTGALELTLWMESDRMGYLLPALTASKFETQREVVLNERRQNYENRPYGLASMALLAALYPPNHPYHWPTIGVPDDLRAATLEGVHDFFRRHYHPGNASLAIAGDVQPGVVLPLVEAYFGEIASGSTPGRAAPEPAPSSPTKLFFEDRVELPRLYLCWHSPAIFAPGDAELDLLADLLAGGKSSRLYRSLVYERRVATDVTAMQNSRELSSFFQVVVTAAPGRDLSTIEQAILDEIDRMATDGPQASELERSLAQAEAHFVYRLQNVGGFGGKSDQLNAYHVFLGDPGYFERDLLRYRTATVGAIQAAAAEHVAPIAPVSLSIVPRGQAALAAADSERVTPS